MKLIGRRSVASLMRWGLGLINVFVMIGIAGCAAALVFTFVDPNFGTGLAEGLQQTPTIRWDSSGGVSGRGGRGNLTITLIMALGAMISTWWIINRLRRIFLAVNQGDAFEPANVGRLQGVGLGLIGVQFATAILTLRTALPEGVTDRDFDINLGASLGILIVFMLAEVFRQGSAMRDDAQMTV